MAKNDNLTDYLVDLADAIRTKKGITRKINAQDFASEILSIESGGGGDTPVPTPSWTGHADAEGLKAIGWDDDDIAYYQANGVNWNQEDDEYHKVTDDNKALYGLLTASNISSYRDRIVYLPKIDISGKTSLNSLFYNCTSLVAIPLLDTQNVTNMGSMFNNCYSLASVPLLNTQKVTTMSSTFNGCYSLAHVPLFDTQNVTNMGSMFYNCYSLTQVPLFNTQKVTSMGSMFYNCYSLVSIPLFDTQNVTNMDSMFRSCYSLVSFPLVDTQKVTNMGSMFGNCYSLMSVPLLSTQKVTSMSSMFSNCASLTTVKLKNVTQSYQFNNSSKLSKESLLFLINNESATSAITIKLNSYAYTRLATDADIVSALSKHSKISISQ